MLDDSYKIRYKTVPLAVSYQICDNRPTDAHNHAEFEILLITDGRCKVTINDYHFFAEKGDMIFINPLEIHSIEVCNASDYSHICICFDTDLIGNKDISTQLKNEEIYISRHIPGYNAHCEFLAKCFLDILQSHENSDMYTEMEVKAYVSIMFSHLLKNKFLDFQTKKTKNTFFCADVLKYISNNFSENITSKEVANALSYNQSYFCRNFKRNFNKCFSDYLTMYRISASKKMLEDTSKTITQIAHECGFNSASYYTISFKKYLGVLPSEYREKVNITK